MRAGTGDVLDDPFAEFFFVTKLCHFAPPPPLGGERGKMAELRKETNLFRIPEIFGIRIRETYTLPNNPVERLEPSVG